MQSKIQNLAELKARIAYLTVRRTELEDDFQKTTDSIVEKFKYPSKILHKIGGWIFPSSADSNDPTGKDSGDWVSRFMKAGLPLIMSRFIFPQSGIITKALMAIVSQQATKSVNADVFTDLFSKVKSWVSPRPKKVKHPVLEDYGIPPDSETF